MKNMQLFNWKFSSNLKKERFTYSINNETVNKFYLQSLKR